MDYYLSKGYSFGRYIDWEIKELCGKENGMYGKSHTKEVCNKISKDISKRNTNRKWIHKGSQEKFVEDKEIGYYLTEGWELGRRKYYSNGKKVGSSTKNKIMVYKEEIVKSIFKTELEGYLKQGWKKGNPLAITEGPKNLKWINNGKERKMVSIEEIQSYLDLGWKKGIKFER